MPRVISTTVFALTLAASFHATAADSADVTKVAAGDAPKAVAGAPKVAGAESARAIGLLQQIDEGFVALFEKVAPSVVVIEARKKMDVEETGDELRRFDFLLRDGAEGNKPEASEKDPHHSMRLPQAPARTEGSGFVIRADGFIVTNQHVVADAEKLEVRLKDGRILPGRLVGSDDRSDIAVIKIEAKDLPVAELGDSEKLRIGQLVCAIGAPFNQDYSFTCGWVSGKGRTNLLGPNSNAILYEDYIQTDAFINPGNSGGPLFDVDGRVIGMNTLINGIGRGLAFAIPSNMVSEVTGQLIATGRVLRPWLGIRIETLSDNREIRERVNIDSGIVVRTIEANAPAYRSDLRPADIITEIDGVKVSTAHDLQKEVLKKKIGQVILLSVLRGSAGIKVPVTAGELPGDFVKAANAGMVPRKEPKNEGLGLKLQDRPKGGVIVVEVVPQGAASKAELQADDVITEIDGKALSNAASALQLLESFLAVPVSDPKAKKTLLINLDRKGRKTFTSMERPK